jgi:ABC-type glycerol-3-phosphate transport system substrate-binding protein
MQAENARSGPAGQPGAHQRRLSMRKRTFTLMAAAMLMLGLLLPALAQGKTQVLIWHSFAEGQRAALNEIANAFNALNPGVKVVVKFQPRTGFEDKVLNGARTGAGPNMIIHSAAEAAKHVDAGDKRGFALDFAAFLSPEEMERVKARLPRPLYKASTAFEGGGMHIMPVYCTGPVLFYNKTMLDALELAPPATWEELEAAARAIKEKYGVPGFATDIVADVTQMLIMQSGSGYIDVESKKALEAAARAIREKYSVPGFVMDGVVRIMQMLIMQSGSGYIDMENKKALIDTPEAAGRVQWFGDLAKEGVFSLKPAGQSVSGDFKSKKAGMYLSGADSLLQIKPAGFELGVAPAIFEGVPPWYPVWNHSAIAFRTNEAADRATVAFIRFLTSAENAAKFAMASGALCPYADAGALPEYRAWLNGGSPLSDSLKAVEAGLAHAGALPNVSVSATLRAELERAVARVAAGEASAVDALKAAAEIVNSEWAAE